MSVLQKGGLVVVAGTILASVLILWSSSDNAEKVKSATAQVATLEAVHKVNGVSKNDISIGENSANTSVTMTQGKTQEVATQKTKMPESNNSSSSLLGNRSVYIEQKSVDIAPPPGPFFEEKSSLNLMQKQKVDSPKPPAAPNAPIKKVVGSFPVAPKMNSLTKEVIRKKPIPVEKSLEASKAPTSFTTKKSSQQPILMQKPPVQPILKKNRPNKPSGFVRQGAPNSQGYFPVQRYMVVPAPMQAPSYNYGYPQATRYGGGYSYVPPLQYMMPMMRQQPINQQVQPKVIPPKGNDIK